MFDINRAVADAGVPVMSHVGLLPHYVHKYGGFRMQGRTPADGSVVQGPVSPPSSSADPSADEKPDRQAGAPAQQR